MGIRREKTEVKRRKRRGRQEGRSPRYDREASAPGCPRLQASFQPFCSMEGSGL